MPVKTLIESALDQRPNDFMKQFNDIIAAKAAALVDARKQQLAQTWLGTEEPVAEVEEPEVEDTAEVEEPEEVDEEQLDELSPSTLKSYTKKADKEGNKLEKKIRSQKDDDSDEDQELTRKYSNRTLGSMKAKDKLTK